MQCKINQQMEQLKLHDRNQQEDLNRLIINVGSLKQKILDLKITNQKSILPSKRFKGVQMQNIFQFLGFKQLLQIRLVNRFFMTKVRDYFPFYKIKVDQMLSIQRQNFLDQEHKVDEVYEKEGSAQQYFVTVQVTKDAIEQLTKKMVAELKSFSNPPKEVVEIVKILNALMNGQGEGWQNARKCLSITNLSKILFDLNIHEIPFSVIDQVKQLEGYSLDGIRTVSVCAYHFLVYLRGIWSVHQNEYFKSLIALNRQKRNLYQVEKVEMVIRRLLNERK